MAQRLNAWGEVPRQVRNHTQDSTRWDTVQFRGGDIVIATWAKSGTTWVQQIIGQLLYRGVESHPVFDVSPWVENRTVPIRSIGALLDSQPHRRLMKTHLPADAIPYDERVRYIYVGRDGRDVVWSWYNHHRNLLPIVYDMLNNSPGRVGPPLLPPTEDLRAYFNEWLDGNGYPLWPFWENVRSWWNLRERENVLLIHFAELKSDLRGQIQRIADFLKTPLDPALLPVIERHCSFEYMKQNADRISRTLQFVLKGGAGTFINKGVGGDWRTVLTDDDLRKYEDCARTNLLSPCAEWMYGHV